MTSCIGPGVVGMTLAAAALHAPIALAQPAPCAVTVTSPTPLTRGKPLRRRKGVIIGRGELVTSYERK